MKPLDNALLSRGSTPRLWYFNSLLTRGIRETTIGEFLKNHPSILTDALGTRRFIYEPSLDWIDGPSGNSDKAINPDLMIERQDGFFDIYDLKTALLEKQRITKGERKRRRFIDYVQEGVAQLANYNEYFEFASNRDFADQKYGIKVRDPSGL